MKELTTFITVLVAIFIWWSAIFHADAQSCQQWGDTTFCSDGTTIQQDGGMTTYTSPRQQQQQNYYNQQQYDRMQNQFDH